MNLNATLLVQLVTFIIFVVLTMKYIWPPIMKALNERQKRIAEGLEFAEKSEHDLELARRQAQETLREANLKASHMIEEGNKRAVQIVEEAKEAARQESKRIVDNANELIDQEKHRVRQQLRGEVAGLAIAGAEKILARTINADDHRTLLDELAREI